MPEKKHTRSTSISDSEILAMYEAIIPLLTNNPEGLNLAYQVNNQLLQFVQYDFDHYIMSDPRVDRVSDRIRVLSEKWERFGSDNSSIISILPTGNGTEGENFDEDIEPNYLSALARSKALHPEGKGYHYHRIESQTHPRIVVGFFRVKSSSSNNDFTLEEKKIFAQLTPHVLSLYRAVLNNVYHSDVFQYFALFAQLGSKLASDYSLSESEVSLIPDILFGYSGEEIAERHFVSPATVKTHINHILKKTGTKSRLDFIGKFFTSPDHVQL